MEHRWGGRTAVSLDIRIWRPGEQSVAAQLTDISLSGAYVRTETVLTAMALVELGMTECHRFSPGLRAWRLPARVVRRDSTGVGVEWHEFATELLREVIWVATVGPRGSDRSDQAARENLLQLRRQL